MVALGWCAAAPALADDKKETKEEKKPEPPTVAVVTPLAITPGTRHAVRLRGTALTNATSLRFTREATNSYFTTKALIPLDVSKDAEAKQLGDSQWDLQMEFSANATVPSTNDFVVTSPHGDSAPRSLLVLPPERLGDEKEPNDGFKQAQPLAANFTVQGRIQEAADVDVFRVEGRAGQRLCIEVHAARSGSPMDSLLTLYDTNGNIVATNDDANGGADAQLIARLATDGAYFISVTDAYDRGGASFGYLLAFTPREQ